MSFPYGDKYFRSCLDGLNLGNLILIYLYFRFLGVPNHLKMVNICPISQSLVKSGDNNIISEKIAPTAHKSTEKS